MGYKLHQQNAEMIQKNVCHIMYIDAERWSVPDLYMRHLKEKLNIFGLHEIFVKNLFDVWTAIRCARIRAFQRSSNQRTATLLKVCGGDFSETWSKIGPQTAGVRILLLKTDFSCKFDNFSCKVPRKAHFPPCTVNYKKIRTPAACWDFVDLFCSKFEHFVSFQKWGVTTSQVCRIAIIRPALERAGRLRAWKIN